MATHMQGNVLLSNYQNFKIISYNNTYENQYNQVMSIKSILMVIITNYLHALSAITPINPIRFNVSISYVMEMIA